MEFDKLSMSQMTQQRPSNSICHILVVCVTERAEKKKRQKNRKGRKRATTTTKKKKKNHCIRTTKQTLSVVSTIVQFRAKPWERRTYLHNSLILFNEPAQSAFQGPVGGRWGCRCGTRRSARLWETGGWFAREMRWTGSGVISNSNTLADSWALWLHLLQQGPTGQGWSGRDRERERER